MFSIKIKNELYLHSFSTYYSIFTKYHLKKKETPFYGLINNYQGRKWIRATLFQGQNVGEIGEKPENGLRLKNYCDTKTVKTKTHLPITIVTYSVMGRIICLGLQLQLQTHH
jgi:hypothetical protein